VAKYNDIHEQAKAKALAVIADADSWKGFLASAAYSYQYSFPNQLLIFDQRPDANAVATMQSWNEKAHRWIRRGTHGIALMNNRGPYGSVRYVFDMRDTIPAPDVPSEMPWFVNAENRSAVLNKLTEGNAAISPQDACTFEASRLFAEREQVFYDALAASLVGSSMEWADVEEQRQTMERIVVQSVTYMACVRCGLPLENLDTDAFDSLHEFDTVRAASCVGSAVQQTSRRFMMELGAVVQEIDSVAISRNIADNVVASQKEIEKSPKEAEQNGIHEHERVHGSQSGEPTADAESGQVRRDASEVSAGVRAGDVRPDDIRGNAVSEPAGNGAEGTAANRADDERTAGADPGTQPQYRPDGLDTANEQRESTGRGTGDADAVRAVTHEQSNIPTVAESDKTPSAISLPDFPKELIPPLLCAENSSRPGNAEIIRFYKENSFNADRVPFLTNGYKDIWTEVLLENNHRVGFHADEAGLRVWEGSFLFRTSESKLPWESVAFWISDFIDAGNLIASIKPNEVEQLSFMQEQPANADRGIELAAEVAEALGLQSPDAQQEAIAKSTKKKWSKGIEDTTGTVIDEPNIVKALTSGSGFAEGKMRIMHQFSHVTDGKTLADWLKHEYGIGGQSWTFLDGHSGWFDHNGKGLELRYGSYGDESSYWRHLNWPEVATRLRYLIQTDKYFTEKNKEQYPLWLAEHHPEESELVKNDPIMQQAKKLIRQFLWMDEEENGLFTDLHHIELTHSSTVEEYNEISVEVDLLQPTMRYYVDDTVSHEEQYESLKAMVEGKLTQLDSNILINNAIDYADSFRLDNEGEHLTRREIIPGAVVYLENDKPFTVESIGILDVHLRDEEVPLIGRAISREELSRFLAANKKNDAFELPVLVTPTPQAEKENEPPDTTYTTSQVAAYPAGENGLPYDVVIEKLHINEPQQEPETPFVEQVMEDVEALAEPYHYDPINYTAPYAPIPPAGPKAKYAVNIEAIRLLKQIEQRMANGGTPANEQEQSTLARYCGWGGLADAFDPNKSNWSAEYAELKSLLTDAEYSAARESTLTAFYTPPEVIHSIYRALERMGVTGGNILEPSMGVGAFFGHKPSSFDQNNAKLYGVELDDLTGRIAKQLYQKAKIQIKGFEKADLPESFFDVALGNVPFGDFSVSDRPYDKLHFRIHDYFIAKAIDKVRTGGIIAFITTSGTLDKKSEEVRKYINARCDLIGAVRLPNNTFKANAGTEAVADILFLQKRDRILEQDVPWLHLSETEDGIPINGYFAEHPEMICGEMQMVSGPYGSTPTCVPTDNGTLEEQLDAALQNLHGQITKAEVVLDEQEENGGDVIEADPYVRNYSFTLQDGKIYYRENSIMRRITANPTAEGRIKSMIAMRDTVRDLIQAQLDDYPDEEITRLQGMLNRQYDAFHNKYGLINSRGAAQAFQDDSGYFLLCSLEDLDDEHNYRGKTDMFYKRTIRAAKAVDHVDTATEALALSIGEQAKIDFAYMEQLTGKTQEELVSDLTGVIFRDPLEKQMDGSPLYLPADEYLSGDVRHKLAIARQAAENDHAFAVNVQALEQVQPKDLEASEIAVRLGATWIDTDTIKEFADELVDAPYQTRRNIRINYVPYTGTWNVTNKSMTGGNIKATVTYGTSRANFYHILEESLNLRAIRIFDIVRDDDGEHRVLNSKATQEAQEKQRQVEEAFKEWIFKDQSRRKRLVAYYNEQFNSTRPREYDGSHIQFHGMNPGITLRPHQKNAIAHILYGHNTLLAHVVGGGKTFEMVAAAMEKKRLGLCSKTMICVPNHLTEQLASEALLLYPNANILVAKRADFEKSRRKRFCAKIATGNYDIIVIGHSQFERIPLSQGRQMQYLQDQISEIMDQVAELKAERAENFTIKQMERMKKQLQKRLEKLNDTVRRDDVVTFEELGVDSLMVDEAHNFKNMMVVSKMRNVAGLSQTESQKASDLLMKCMYLDEQTGGRGITFATGTPLSNSMTELYTMMRYLQNHTLKQKGLGLFDSWASTFGETVTAIELSPEGTGYRTKTRFAKFYNLPELMSFFKEAADIQTADMLNLPVPKLAGGKPINVTLKPSEIQKRLVADLGERADLVRRGEVDPTEDNMLRITNDGRKLALDQRLIDPKLPDDPDSKVNACVENVFRIWNDTKEQRLTQMVFCDLSTPKPGVFNVYYDVRDKLIARGVPAEEIQFIHDANTELRKAELFAKVRSGAVRVLMGSTAKMGAGTNAQRLLVALHHLDVPWRPSDIEQREGRMVRQGNKNSEVSIFRYVTESTFDAYSWQLIENKQRFISQIMTSKSPARTCDDMDEAALSYAEVKALAAGNPAIREKMDLDIQVARLKTLKAAYTSQHYRLEDAISIGFPAEVQKLKQIIANAEADSATVATNTTYDAEQKEVFSITLMDKTYDKREDAGRALLGMLGSAMNAEHPVELGTYRGFKLQIMYFALEKEFRAQLVGAGTRSTQLGADPAGNTMRLSNLLNCIAESIPTNQEKLAQLQKQIENAKAELQQPFKQETELAEKSKRLAELDALLNMNERDNVVDATPDEPEPTTRPRHTREER
jgi:N12 class adenine-specific DNA methylase